MSEVEKRHSGNTKWRFNSLVKYAFEGIFCFSTKPLRFATILGFIASLLSFGYLIFTLIEKLFFTIEVSGYATIVGLITFLAGIQLICMGIIGEYLANTYIEVKQRPIYIAKKKYDHKD